MNDSPPTIAYVGIGSNVGDRKQTMNAAIEQLNGIDCCKVNRVSKFIETPAEGMGVADPFLNGAIEVETTLGAGELLDVLLAVEQSLGRMRSDKWQPRTIDLDLLLFGQRIIADDRLIIPHPLMHTRLFVLNPLAEIAPQLLHPLLGKTIEALQARLVAGSLRQ